MLCDECHENESVYTVSVIINESPTVRHLCPDCMARMNNHIVSGNIRNLLSSILSAITGHDENESEVEETPAAATREPETDTSTQCPQCGMTLNRFTKSGKLGCPACYEAFRPQLQPMLKQIHGHVQHVGRHPLDTEAAQRSRSLQEALTRQMEQAVLLEDFETAARLRDQIRAIAAKEEQL